MEETLPMDFTLVCFPLLEFPTGLLGMAMADTFGSGGRGDCDDAFFNT